MSAVSRAKIAALEELKGRGAVWVIWRTESRNGKATKVPHRADGRGKADSTDPETWATFETSAAKVKVNGASGLGAVLTPPYIGIDLDNCRTPETGEIEEWAQAIVNSIDSYTEVSPSGRGLHIWIKGRLPRGGNRKGSIEMYDQDRYFTVTGNHLDGTPETIEERQAELEALHAELFGSPGAQPAPSRATSSGLTDWAVLEAARSARNGAKVASLLAGDASGYTSASEADQALMSLLAFYTQDPGQLDRLYRGSGLYREKWDREDYQQRTIAKALSGLTDVYEPAAGEIRNGVKALRVNLE